MASLFVRAALPLAVTTLAFFAPLATRADEPPAPAPVTPEKSTPDVAKASAVEAGVAFDRELSFDQGVAKGKAEGKAVFIDFWREH